MDERSLTSSVRETLITNIFFSDMDLFKFIPVTQSRESETGCTTVNGIIYESHYVPVHS